MQEHPVNEMLLNSNSPFSKSVLLTTSSELNSDSRRHLPLVFSSNRCIPTICIQFDRGDEAHITINQDTVFYSDVYSVIEKTLIFV